MIAAPQLDAASKKAAAASQVYSKTLSMRIFLKRSEDLANCLPVDTRLRNDLESTRKDLVTVFQKLLVGFSGNASSSCNATDVTSGDNFFFFFLLFDFYEIFLSSLFYCNYL
jgi:hypothetical protein